MSHNDLTYQIISIDDLSLIDFSQIEEEDEDTIRKSVDESQFVIKWHHEPTFIEDGSVVPIQTLNHENCLTLMQTEAWQVEEEIE